MNYWKIHEEGRKECIRVDNDVNIGINPYGSLTEECKVWNIGWNSYDNSSDNSSAT